MVQEVESVVRELQLLANRRPLSPDELGRAKKLMSRLRELGFTNKEVGALTDGGWSQPTVKLYTRGARTVDLAQKKRLTDLLNEIVRRNIWVNDIELAVSVIRKIVDEGLSLERVLEFHFDVEKSKVDLEGLIEVYREMAESRLTVEELTQTLSYKRELDGFGITLEGLRTICQVSRKYGGYQPVLEAMDRYEGVRAIEDDIARVRNEEIDLKRTVGDLRTTRDSLELDIKKLQENQVHFKRAIEMCKTLLIDYGLSVEEIEVLQKCCKGYGDLSTFLEAAGKFKNLTDIQNSIRELSTKKTELESRIKELEQRSRKISGIESKLPEIQNSLNQAEQRIRALGEPSIILDLIVRPEGIIEPVDKVLATMLTLFTALETYIDKQSHRLAYASTLKRRLEEVRSLIGEYFTDELRRARA